MIEAELLEDCARNLRIRYRMPEPVTPDLLRAAGAERVTVNRFSDLVAGASDHVVAWLSLTGAVRGEAVVGDNDLTVTYGSLQAIARPEDVSDVESRLARAVWSCARSI